MKSLIKKAIDVICFSGTIGIAIKFITLFNNWLYFPLFPNIFDSIFLIISVSWLFMRLLYTEKYIEILFSIKIYEVLEMIDHIEEKEL